MAKHRHEWRKPSKRSNDMQWGCSDRGFPMCHKRATLTCACGEGRCAAHAPKPRKRKPFERWSEHLGVLMYDGKPLGTSADRLAYVFNRQRVVLKVRP